MFGISALSRFGRNRQRKVRRLARGREPGRLARSLRLESLEERRLLSLSDFGPVNPTNGFPTWFEDSNGVRVELMPFYQGDPPFNNGQPLVADPLSLAAPPEPGNAFSEAIGFGEEAFWWSADATMAVPGGQALLVLAQEAAFVNATPVDGDQFAFGRIRVRADAPFDGTYTVTHPYGELVFENVIAGVRAINVTNESGDVPPFANRALLLDQNPIGPFLVAANAPAGYLGDAVTPSTVTGSPTGQNVFSITGPFNGPGTSVTFTTDLFTVSGRRFVAEPPVVAQPIADLVAPVDAVPTVIDVSGVFTDPDIATGDVLTLSVVSDNPAVVAASLNAAGTQLTLTFQPGQSGTANVTVRATDLAGLFVEDAFTATASPFFNPPTLVPPGIADVTAAEDAAPLVIDLNGVFTDADLANGDVLTFSAVSADPALVAAGVVDAQLTLTFQPNANGIAAVTVTATDRAGQSVSDTFSVTVTPVNNDPPTVAQPIADRTTLVDSLPLAIDLAAVFTDPDLPNGDLLALSAVSNNLGLVAATVTDGKLRLAFQPNTSGVAVVSVTATDSSGLTVTDDFTMTVAGFSDIEPVSAISGLTGNGPSLLDNALEQATSADGRFVVFTSLATDLAGPGQDTNGILTDVFLYDRADQSVTLISRKAGTSQTANGDSLSPLISADGTKIAFLSAATNLVPGQVDTNGVEDLFLFDSTTGTMSLISHAPGLPTTAGDGSVLSATMSADGTAIAFDSLATNLVTLGLANAAFTNPGGGLVAAGAPHPVHGFPAWYQDSRGVAVDLQPFYLGDYPFNNGQLLVPNPMSISAPPTPGNAFSEAIGFDDEAFWWAADASIPDYPAGRALLVLALEAAFMGDASAVFGNQLAFGRIRTRFDVPVDGDYTFTHPYGSITFENVSAIDGIFYSNDNGDIYPYDNNRLLSTNPVGPFLIATNPPPGFLGDPAVPSTVTGSPLGQNFFSITGPFNGIDQPNVTYSTDLFTVVGRRYSSDKNNASDVFLWRADPGTPGGAIELVSRAAGSTGEAGNGASRNPIIDRSGNSVLYTSEATNLVASQNDTNGFTDVFLFNDQLQTTALVSGASGSQSVTANGASQAEAIDFVGAFAVIGSTATNLATELDLAGAIVPVAIQDTNLGRDIYLFDAGTRVMTLVSHAADNPTRAGNAPSAAPRISADGRFVAFTSRASDIAPGVTDTAGFQDAFLYDRLTDISELVSHAAGSPTTPANGESSAPVLSADGRFVAFESLATDLLNAVVDTNGAADVFALDRVTGIMELISEIPLAAPTDPPTAGNGASTHPMISADGQSIVFNSIASNLFPSDGNAVSDVFLYSGITNSAPVLDPAIRPSLAPVNEGTSAGTTVDAILATAGLYSDPDGPAFKGIAIVGQDEANGVWEFSINRGAQWTPFGVVGDNQAILLSADGTGQNRVRFVPTDPLFVGTATFNLRGWDGTDENPSGATNINVSINGGETAYSPEIATADAPITPAGQHQPTVVLPGIADVIRNEDDAPADVVMDLGGLFADADIPNGDSLTLSFTVASANPDLFTADLTGTQLTLAFQPNQAGTATVSVTATDQAGLKAAETFTVTVNPVNDAPTLDAIPDPAAIDEDAGAQTVSLSGIAAGGGPDEASQTLTITATSSNPSLIPNPVVSYASPNATGSLSFTPAANANGTATITVTVTDSGDTANGGVNSFSRTFTVTVNLLNDAPTVVQPIADRIVLGNSPLVIELGAVFADVDDAQLALSVANDNPGLLAASLTGTQLTLTFQPNPTGAATVSVTATDLAGAQAVDEFIVTISQPPAAQPIPPVTVAEDSLPVQVELAGVFSDPDPGDQLTLSVVNNNNPGLVTAILEGTLLTLTFAPDQNGAATVFVMATDQTGLTVTAPITITVTPVNDAPVANAQTVAANEDTAASVTLTGSDIDSAALTYVVVAGPASGTLSGTAPNLTYTPAANFNGADSFTFKVNDGALDSAVATVAITVAPVNDAPMANAQAAAANEDSPTAILLTASDVDGDPLTYTVVAAPLHGTLTGAAPNLTYTPAPDYFGPDSFTFKANDGIVDSAAATVSITVSGAPPAVTIDQAATQPGVAVDGPIHFTATFTDPVTGFNGADLLFSGTAPGAIAATVTQVDAEGMVYDVAVSGMTGRGTVIAQVRAVAAVDRTGHPSTASTSTDNEVFFEPAQVSDNNDPSFAVTGSWGAHPGYRGGALVSLNRAAGTTATWTVPVTPGQYQVLLTWTAGGAHAQNATFAILDGGVTSARVSVNQRLAPAGVAFDGVNWRSLGTFSIYSNSLAVALNAVANGSVDADAVRIVRVGDLSPTTTRIVDDGDTSFATQGAWNRATVGYQRDVRRHARGGGADSATWTFLVEPGDYEVAATWAAFSRAANNSPFTVTGATSFTTRLNQRVAPNGFTDAGVRWESLGTVTVTGHLLTVRLSDLANGTVTADAIRIQKVVAPGAAAAQSASASALDATLAAIAGSGGSPQLSSTLSTTRQQAAVDSIFADPAAQLQGF